MPALTKLRLGSFWDGFTELDGITWWFCFLKYSKNICLIYDADMDFCCIAVVDEKHLRKLKILGSDKNLFISETSHKISGIKMRNLRLTNIYSTQVYL